MPAGCGKVRARRAASTARWVPGRRFSQAGVKGNRLPRKRTRGEKECRLYTSRWVERGQAKLAAAQDKTEASSFASEPEARWVENRTRAADEDVQQEGCMAVTYTAQEAVPWSGKLRGQPSPNPARGHLPQPHQRRNRSVGRRNASAERGDRTIRKWTSGHSVFRGTDTRTEIFVGFLYLLDGKLDELGAFHDERTGQPLRSFRQGQDHQGP